MFKNFDDYWLPFLGKQGAAPTYLASVNEEIREEIRVRLQARLLPSADGTIPLRAIAWAVQEPGPRDSDHALWFGVSRRKAAEWVVRCSCTPKWTASRTSFTSRMRFQHSTRSKVKKRLGDKMLLAVTKYLA